MIKIFTIFSLIFMLGQALIMGYLLYQEVVDHRDKTFEKDHPTNGTSYIVVYNRAFSSSLYFGPFGSLEEVDSWAKQTDLPGAAVLDLIEPHTWSRLPYEQRWSYPLH